MFLVDKRAWGWVVGGLLCWETDTEDTHAGVSDVGQRKCDIRDVVVVQLEGVCAPHTGSVSAVFVLDEELRGVVALERRGHGAVEQAEGITVESSQLLSDLVVLSSETSGGQRLDLLWRKLGVALTVRVASDREPQVGGPGVQLDSDVLWRSTDVQLHGVHQVTDLLDGDVHGVCDTVGGVSLGQGDVLGSLTFEVQLQVGLCDSSEQQEFHLCILKAVLVGYMKCYYIVHLTRVLLFAAIRLYTKDFCSTRIRVLLLY